MPFDNTDDDRNSRIEQELAHALAGLDTFLDDVIDVEAGLAAILTQARHDEATEALDDVTDVEAGLATILTPGTRSPIPPVAETLEVQFETRTGRITYTRRLDHGRYDVRRLRLRRDLAPLRRLFDRTVLINTITHTIPDYREVMIFDAELLRNEIESLATDVERVIERECVPAGHIQTLMAASVNIANWMRVLRNGGPKLPGIEQELRQMSEQLVSQCLRAVDAAVAHECRSRDWDYLLVQGEMLRCGAGERLRSPERVDWLFNDFTDGDLTAVTVHIEDLDGLRWSTVGTEWPTTLDTADLAARSRETAPGSGVYVVLPGPAHAMA